MDSEIEGLKDAEELVESGLALSDTGDVDGAEAAYLAAVRADPTWSAPLYKRQPNYRLELPARPTSFTSLRSLRWSSRRRFKRQMHNSY